MNERLVNEFLRSVRCFKGIKLHIYTDIYSSIKDLHGDGGGVYGKVRG